MHPCHAADDLIVDGPRTHDVPHTDSGHNVDLELAALTITVTEPDRTGRVTATIAGELDHDTVGMLRSRLHPLLSQPQVRQLVLDLTAVTFLNAGGLSALADARQRANAARLRLVLRCGDQRAVLRPLQITGLLEYFDFDSTPTR